MATDCVASKSFSSTGRSCRITRTRPAADTPCSRGTCHRAPTKSPPHPGRHRCGGRGRNTDAAHRRRRTRHACRSLRPGQQWPLLGRKIDRVDQHFFLRPACCRREGQPHRSGNHQLVVIVQVDYQPFVQRDSLHGALLDPLRVHNHSLRRTSESPTYATASSAPILLVLLCALARVPRSKNALQTSINALARLRCCRPSDDESH